MERSVNDIELLLSRQLDEVDGIARYPDCQLWILLRMLHRIKQGFFIKHVDVQVVSILDHIPVKYCGQIVHTFIFIFT
ncbi:hypothetical protein D3C76_1735780 [compost metagenome]